MKGSKKWLTVAAIALLALGSFVFGFDVCLHLKSSPSADVRRDYLRQAGDAPPNVRSAVLVSLRAFQKGYDEHDPAHLNAFMERLFAKNADVLLIGTDSEEWARGYTAVSNFIREDWLHWGRFSIAVDDAIVSSVGDVAWVTSVGTVRLPRTDRPVRFSAILTRNGDRWIFRQLQFQWDDRDPAPAELLRVNTHVRIAKLLLDQVRRLPQTATRMFAITGRE